MQKCLINHTKLISNSHSVVHTFALCSWERQKSQYVYTKDPGIFPFNFIFNTSGKKIINSMNTIITLQNLLSLLCAYVRPVPS